MLQTNWLHELPPEILLLILEKYTTPRDLYSLLRSSSKISALFAQKKWKVLREVLKNAFHPAILPLAIAVCDAARVCCESQAINQIRSSEVIYSPENPFFDSHTQYRFDLVREIIESANLDRRSRTMNLINDYDSHKLRMSTVLISLSKVWFLVDHFIQCFTVQFELSKNQKSWQKRKRNVQKVSRFEYDRLQRAFLHFELYRRLFGGISQDNWERFMRNENDFILNLHCFELVDLWSVHHYLVDRIDRVFDGVDDYIANQILKIKQRKYEKRKDQDYWTHCSLRTELPRNWSRGRNNRADFLAVLGLPLCYRFFNMQIPEQASVVHLLRWKDGTLICNRRVGNILRSFSCRTPANEHLVSDSGNKVISRSDVSLCYKGIRKTKNNPAFGLVRYIYWHRSTRKSNSRWQKSNTRRTVEKLLGHLIPRENVVRRDLLKDLFSLEFDSYTTYLESIEY